MYLAILLLTLQLNGILTVPMAITSIHQFDTEQDCNSFFKSTDGDHWIKQMISEFTAEGNKIISVDRTFCTPSREDRT